MAPKKRLSDLLREEVKKPAEAETSPATEAEPAKKDNRSTGTARSNRQKAQSAKSTAADPSPPETVAAPIPTVPADATGADPVGPLKAALEAAKNQEVELKQEIARLTAELKTQTESTQQLQTQLQQVDTHTQQLETELSEAKHTVLQLVEVNTQLKQDLESAKARSQPQAAAPPPAKPRQEEAKPAKSAPLAASALSQQEMLRRRQQDSLAHPVFPAGPAPGHLSEVDLGWVD